MSVPGKYGEVKNIKLEATGQLPERECYDFYSDSQTRETTANKDIFLRDALVNQDQLFYWAQTAYQVFKLNPDSYWDHAGNGWDKDFGDGHYFDMIDYLCNKHEMSSGDDKCVSLGLKLANSLDEVEKAAGSMVENLIAKKLKANSFIERATIDVFHEKTDTDTVFYSIAGNCDRYGKTYQFGYTVLGLAFYNFQLKVVSDGTPYNTAIKDMTVEEAIAKGGISGFTYHDNGSGETVVYPAINSGKQEITQTVSLTTSDTQMESNTLTNSEEYHFSEMLGVSVELDDILKTQKLTVEMQFSAEQVIATAYSSEKSVSKEKSKSSSITATLPPHTALEITQKQNGCVTTLEYDCPVMVQFDVAVFSICGTCYDDNAAVQTFSTAGYDQRSFATVFASSENGNAGEDASENLYLRCKNYAEVPGYEKKYGVTCGKSHNKGVICNELDWGKILKQGKAKTEYKKGTLEPKEPQDLVSKLATERPMSCTGGMLEESGTAISSSAEGALPLYPLNSITLSNEPTEYNLGVGDKIYPFNWEIVGYDTENVPFYGFDVKQGNWILVNESGQEIEDNPVAGIGHDPLTDALFIQGKGEGSVYAKYLIRDNFYTCKAGTVITNETISSTVYVKLIVHATELQGHIDAQGSVV